MSQKLWTFRNPPDGAFERLLEGGFSPLLAQALAGRGVLSPSDAQLAFPPETEPFADPFLMDGMEAAAARVRLAVERGERVAIYGDYDVDGITSVCLMVRYLKKHGLDPLYYIPSRAEEGYGLNSDAIRRLSDERVSLIITVDSGVTAVEEAALSKSLGIDMIITDHHECKTSLPDALAVINPRKPGCPYPFKHLAGVGVAFQLIRALSDIEELPALLSEYSDLVAIGTIADVMPLTSENRSLCRRGLAAMERSKHPGIRALLKEALTGSRKVTASVIGFSIAPRLNAAGRMGKATLAVDLLLSEDLNEATGIARTLCDLNRLRQATENQIFEDACLKAAAQMESGPEKPSFLVLTGENWHQGVIGIVASRISERFCLPVFLICLEGDVGKGSARSTAGVDIYAAMEYAAPFLKTWGGHEYAAGFTIRSDDISDFQGALEAFAKERLDCKPKPPEILIDAVVEAPNLTIENVSALEYLEPTGAGNPAPAFCLKDIQIFDIVPIGKGKGLRLRVKAEESEFAAFYFGVPPELLPVWEGERADIAFRPELDAFRGKESVRLIIKDVRLSEAGQARYTREMELYRRHFFGDTLTPSEAAALTPERADFTALWRHIRRNSGPDGRFHASLGSLSRRVELEERVGLSRGKLLVALRVLEESGLILFEFDGETLLVSFQDIDKKADLSASDILKNLRRMKNP